MQFNEITDIILERGFPDTVNAFKIGIPLLMSINQDTIIEEFENTYEEINGLSILDVPLSDFLSILDKHLDILSDTLGVEFHEDSLPLHKAERLSLVLDMSYLPETEYEVIEEFYAGEFVEEYNTTMGYEMSNLMDISGLYKFQKYRNTKGIYMKNIENKSFVKAFTGLLQVLNGRSIPGFFKSVGSLEDLSLEYFKVRVPLRTMNTEEIAISILLVSILVEEYRNVSSYDRREFIYVFTNKIPEDKMLDVDNKYENLVSIYHKKEI